MQRIRMLVRYDGTDFAGSQIQPGKRTVAGTLKTGLESLLDQPVKLVFASRTDTGVHADGNVCSFDASLPFPAGRLGQLVNKLLPEDMGVREASAAGPGFHPRFDAMSRTYIYRCYRTDDVRVDRARYVGPFPAQWNIRQLDRALSYLNGEHCFAAYSAAGLEPGQSMCTLLESRMQLAGQEAELRFTANRFLRHMVVRLVGALMQVAQGQVSPQQFKRSLSGARDFNSRPAPAKGLTLVSVQYE